MEVAPDGAFAQASFDDEVLSVARQGLVDRPRRDRWPSWRRRAAILQVHQQRSQRAACPQVPVASIPSGLKEPLRMAGKIGDIEVVRAKPAAHMRHQTQLLSLRTCSVALPCQLVRKARGERLEGAGDANA